MRNFLILAGAAAMAAAMPSLADAQGRGKGKSVQVRADTEARTAVRSGGRARTDARANVRARTRTGAAVDRDGIRARSDARVRADARDSHWVRTDDGRWVRVADQGRTSHPHGCPPGLAGRTPPCVPPGQASRMFREGQRIPVGYRYFVDYGAIPAAQRVRVPEGYRYIYRDDTVYVVDPATSVVRSIIDLID